ncbi:hypothetical protein [Rhodovibrio salinarum]|uniref:Uncharacterized protein n=1 Tax=Rhodovibrio salinarum TaxID=1087 RepID=A0A934QFE5_9PROT|nr:hypothetical protein [Rhodovibrio salinarum]MBK1696031.1 hypothetical protein [Rhodovibrio salinarum]
MIESLLLVIYTATIFLVFRWLIKNDDKPALSDQTGVFSISATSRTGMKDDSRMRSSRQCRRQTTPGKASGAPQSDSESTDPREPGTMVNTRFRRTRRRRRDSL